MRKFRFLLPLLCAVLMSGCYNQESREEILKVYNWADYIDEEVLENFPEWYEEQTGNPIRVIYQTFDINEIMLTKIERGHEDFDVVCPSEYIIERMLKKDLLLPIDTCFGNTPNYLGNQSPFIREQLNQVSQPGRPTDRYAIGYMWGTAGILYNKTTVPHEDALTWETLWNPKYHNRLLMKDSYRDAYGTALIYAHREDIKKGTVTVKDLMNDYSDEAALTVERELKALKPNIAGWEADFGKEMMTKNKADINMTWSGDATWAIEEAAAVGVELGYEVPLEGSNVWYDGWVIPKYARNPKAASYFINYMCQAEVAIANMDATGYVSAIGTPEVLEAMTDETLPSLNAAYFFGPEAREAQLDPLYYPDSAVVARCAMIHDAGEHTEKVLDMWSRVKGDSLGGGVATILLISIAALVVFVVFQKYTRYKQRMASRRHRRHHINKLKR